MSSLKLPVLPLRDVIIFPGMVAPLFVGRPKSILAIEKVMGKDRKIILLAQKDSSLDVIGRDDLFTTGIVANVLQMLRMPDGTLKLLVEGANRVKINSIDHEDGFFTASYNDIFDINGDQIKTEALCRTLLEQFEEYVSLTRRVGPEIISVIKEITDHSKFVDTIAAHTLNDINKKQKILEQTNVQDRAELLMDSVQIEISVLNTEKSIKQRVKNQMDKSQKDYYLNEQIKAIQKELNDGDDGKNEIAEFEKKLSKLKLDKDTKEKIQSEIKKLKMMNSMSAEASIVRNYIDTVLNLPWNTYRKIKSDIKEAENKLNHDHYGLEKIKERILEYLAVQIRVKQLKGPIICFVGPPGVGKTSLAKSIAEATGREFAKMALGGVRDEAEIRGHRRTYVGAMPGKIIQLLKKTKTANPLILLDEIDKMGSDFRGDPANALLEVLDPEQNDKFVDHYIEVEYDLSGVMFIATANDIGSIPRPLLERMEIIKLSGYTEEEKFNIAIQYLLPKQMKFHGLKAQELIISEDSIREIIRYYTREAGVRILEKELAKICRKTVRKIMEDQSIKSVDVNSGNLHNFLGVRKFDFGKVDEHDQVGMCNGLAYSEVGGDLLAIETVAMPGRGNVKLTGKLGETMKESAETAFSFFKFKSLDCGVIPPGYAKKDVHIHLPEGAVPKDGPSAGIALFTSIVSAMTGIPVRKNVAMTGEITLRGRVLAIGGLKEKLLSALRGGISKVILPEENRKDLAELPKIITSSLEIVCVSDAFEVLKHALVKLPQKVSWDENEFPMPGNEKTSGDYGFANQIKH